MTPVEKLLAAARAEIGYLEKASNSQLDSKTANAGNQNYTKFSRDLDALNFYNGRKNGYSWCDIFVDWCFVQAFGVALALQMTGQTLGGYGAGTTASVNYYKSIGRFYQEPQPGDQIFYTQNNGQSFYHTGLVEKVEDGRVFTIEGNTSSAAGIVANGGAVRDKSYRLSYNKIGGYGRPDYSLVQGEDDTMTGAEIIAALTDEQAYELLAKAQRHARTLPEPDWSREEGHWQRAIAAGVVNGNAPEGLVKRDMLAAVLGRKGLL